MSEVVLLWQTECVETLSMCTRRFNQDGLENSFRQVRQVNGGYCKPDPYTLRCAFRKTAVRSVLLPSEHTNCEPDVDGMMAVLTAVTARTNRPVPVVTVTFRREPPPPVMGPCVNTITENVLTYVADYVAINAIRKH